MDVTLPDAVVGRLLDRRYRVGPRIARGGMAAVHEGLDTRLGRSIALKIMHPDLAADHAFVSRFIEEARHAARLSRHPNVVAVYDQGETDDLVWIAMELVRGRTLRALLRERSRLTPASALGVMEAVLSALTAAHRDAMIHRDVKPENILVGEDGRVQVTDFGLARAASATSTVTRGLLLGTVAYVAPEQALGRQASTASDVYSAGIVLYELLTGHPPHQGPTDYVIVRKHVDEDVPPPSREVAGTPAVLDDLVGRATARDPADRYPDAGHFLAAVVQARTLLRADPRHAGPGLEGHRGGGSPAGGPSTATAEAPDTGHSSGSDGEAATDSQATPWLALRAGHGLEPLDEAGVSLALALDAESWASYAAGGDVRGFSKIEMDANPDLQHTDVLPARASTQAGPVGSLSPSSAGNTDTDTDTDTGTADAGAALAYRPVPAFDLDDALTDESRTSRGPWWRRRGVPAFLVVLALAIAAAWGGWWYADGRYVATPDLSRLTVAEASRAADRAGLAVEVVGAEFSETVVPEEVVRTIPQSGAAILPAGTVQLIVSKGPERFTVPDVTGMTREAATLRLGGTNLAVGEVTERYHDDVAAGAVISQGTDPGSMLRRDTPVDLVVSKGREPVTLADWAGKEAVAAQKDLVKDGLKVEVKEVFSDTVDAGVVVGQQPGAGEVFKKDTITLTVSKGPEFLTVPRVEGQSGATARSRLAAVGLGSKITVLLPAGPGNVLRQSPSEGARVRSGTTITLYVF